ncbi:MAG: DUF4388 domain-containing protein [Nostochopsis sp.]
MNLSSSFTDFSLAELFQLIDQGRKSGCLSVCTLPDIHTADSKSQYYYIWFRQGRVVAAAHRLNGQGLVHKITQRNWVNQQLIEKDCQIFSPEKPLGLSLKAQGLLNSEQLNLLFASQMHHIRQLFEIQTGVFKLDSKAPLPSKEMTGLSLRAIEIALVALRTLKSWKILADALPDPSSAIQSIAQGKPQIHLHALEWQVWEFANGSISLSAIANQLNQPIALVQQAAFRLMLSCLIEEVPLKESTPELSTYPPDLNLVNSSKSGQSPVGTKIKIGTLFLQNIVGFLRSNN